MDEMISHATCDDWIFAGGWSTIGFGAINQLLFVAVSFFSPAASSCECRCWWWSRWLSVCILFFRLREWSIEWTAHRSFWPRISQIGFEKIEIRRDKESFDCVTWHGYKRTYEWSTGTRDSPGKSLLLKAIGSEVRFIHPSPPAVGRQKTNDAWKMKQPEEEEEGSPRSFVRSFVRPLVRMCRVLAHKTVKRTYDQNVPHVHTRVYVCVCEYVSMCEHVWVCVSVCECVRARVGTGWREARKKEREKERKKERKRERERERRRRKGRRAEARRSVLAKLLASGCFFAGRL